MIQSLKARDELKLSCLRLILAQIKNKEIEKKTDLTNQETIEVLIKAAKQLRESIAAFEKGGRDDLLGRSKQELTIVFSYLPPEISDEELKNEVKTIIEKSQELYNKNPKMIIGLCMKELKGKADSSRIFKMLSNFSS